MMMTLLVPEWDYLYDDEWYDDDVTYDDWSGDDEYCDCWDLCPCSYDES